MLLRLLGILLLSLILMPLSAVQAAPKESVPAVKKRIQQKPVRSSSKKKSVPAVKKRIQNFPARNSSQLQKSKMISKGSAINIAKKTVNGKLLSARKMNSSGSTVYGVKMLVGDSRVRTVYVDGKTGRVIQVNKD